MPTLNWIGKDAVVNHHQEVPFHLLRCDDALSVGEPGSGNLLVQGDNLTALKALLPYYAGKVKCIYIDPPYNTGDEGWIYNDNVNSPEMRNWLGRVVGREAEDLSRHDKWLSMMYPRLQILVQLLKSDGFLFVSLNDVELARFQVMMDEILASDSYVTTLIWKSRRNLDNRSLHNISVDHEYVVVYRKGEGRFRGTDKDMSKYSNPDNDPRGPWMSDNLVGLATIDRRPNLHYNLINPETGDVYRPPDKGWRYSQETMQQKIAEGRILWPAKKTGRPRHKKFSADLQNEFAGYSSFVDSGNTNEGTEEVSKIMGRERFIFPKPRSLIQNLVQQVTTDDDIILDSFAGTGTTAHAVLALNKDEGTGRKFILVEIESDIAKGITRERIERAINGYTWEYRGDERSEPGLGGGFRYCRLGPTLFDSEGQIRADVSYDELARHVFFGETGEPLSGDPLDPPLVGIHSGTAVYLLFNGVMGDDRRDGGNILTRSVLGALPAHAGPKIIYAEGSTLSPDYLTARQVTFRQTPYQIRVR